MKKFKMIVSFMLIVAIFSSISISSFAAAPTTNVINQFRNFQYIEQGHSSTYVRIMQKFLLYYNSTTGNYISVNGGVDGYFGLGTHYATYEFQKDVFSDSAAWDCKVGSNTWEQVCRAMDFEDRTIEATYYIFKLSGNTILTRVANIWRVIGNNNQPFDIYM